MERKGNDTQPVDWQTAGFTQVFKGGVGSGPQHTGIQSEPSLQGQGPNDNLGSTCTLGFVFYFTCLPTQDPPSEKQYTALFPITKNSSKCPTGIISKATIVSVIFKRINSTPPADTTTTSKNQGAVLSPACHPYRHKKRQRESYRLL